MTADADGDRYQFNPHLARDETITNILVTHSDVSDETAYQMTKQLFENLPEMVAAHAAAKAISAEKGAAGLPIPLHPGAERYYKEKGLL